MPTLHSTKILGDLRVTGITNLNEVGAFTLNGQLTSTLATGTAPFVITSTTPVENLGVRWANVADKPDPKITLAGDLTGSVTLTDLGSGTLTATIAANSVALGTDTTGNYVATVSGITNGGLTIAGSGSENAAVTIGHSNILGAAGSQSGSSGAVAFGGTISIPSISYDINGHITSTTTTSVTLPANPNTDTWRPVEVNNVSIGTNTLDLTNGTNVTLSNNAGVVTFSSPSLSITNGSGNYVSGISVDGHKITETKANWPTFNQNTTGTAAKADTLKTITTDTNANFYPTFVDSDNATAAYESVYTDESFYYNPYTNTLNLSNLSVTGTLTTNNVEMIETSNGIIFEGTTKDGFETTLYAIDPTAVRTIALPNLSGTVALTSQLPTVNDASLTLTVSAGATNTSVTIGTGTGFTANDATNTTYDIDVGPALTNLATTMTGATSGFLKKTSQDTYSLDTNTYLTAHPATSPATSVNNSGRTYIQDITLDSFGHVTGLVSATESVTDTHYTAANFIGATGTKTNAATTNGATYLKLVENSTIRSSHLITGSGATTVSSDANGNITISSTDTNTVYTHPSQALTQEAGNETTLADITLIDSLTTNATGHLTNATWRKLVAGSNVTITPAANGNITIASSFTDTNTASAVDNILDGSNSGTAITYAPYSAQQAKLSFDTSTTDPTRTDRLNLNGYLYAARLHSLGIYGGNLASGNLTIGSTSHTTKGSVSIDSNTAIAGSVTVGSTTVNGTNSGTMQYNSTTKSIEFIFN